MDPNDFHKEKIRETESELVDILCRLISIRAEAIQKMEISPYWRTIMAEDLGGISKMIAAARGREERILEHR